MKMNRRIIQLTTYLIVALTISTAKAEQISFLMLENPKCDYSIPIPKNWTILKDSWPSKNVEFSGSYDNHRIWFNVKTIPLDDWGGKVSDEVFFSEEFWEMKSQKILDEIKKTNDTAKLYEREIFEFGSNRYLYLSTEYRLEKDGEEIFTKTWITRGEDFVYHLTVHLPSNSSDMAYGLVDTIVKNFKISE